MSTSRKRRPRNPPPKPPRRPPRERDASQVERGTRELKLKSTISWDDLNFVDKIDPLAFGDVFRGSWKGVDVAITMFSNSNSNVLASISGLLHHPNIVHVFGILFKDDRCFLVNELIGGGNLFEFIHVEKQVPSVERRLCWMKEIALGMEFLHSCGIVHCGLKSPSVMLGDCMTAKLRICKGSRLVDDLKDSQFDPVGNPTWMAPEIIKEGYAGVSLKCDVYSYAVILYELVTLHLLFEDLNIYSVVFMVCRGKRPTLPKANAVCQPFLHRLISDCWAKDVNVRPAFKDIVNALFLQQYPT